MTDCCGKCPNLDGGCDCPKLPCSGCKLNLPKKKETLTMQTVSLGDLFRNRCIITEAYTIFTCTLCGAAVGVDYASSDHPDTNLRLHITWHRKLSKDNER